MEFLPLKPSLAGILFQTLSLGFMIVSKVALISFILMIAPYAYPIGMAVEFIFIFIIFTCRKSKINNKNFGHFCHVLLSGCNLTMLYPLCSSCIISPYENMICK